MTAVLEAGFPGSAVGRPALAPAVAAVSVGLLVAGTLCTVGAVIVGTCLHLFGIPDDWSIMAAAVTAVAGLVPTVALARRVWRVERHGLDT